MVLRLPMLRNTDLDKLIRKLNNMGRFLKAKVIAIT